MKKIFLLTGFLFIGCENISTQSYNDFMMGQSVHLKGVNMNAYVCQEEALFENIHICYLDSTGKFHNLPLFNNNELEKVGK